MFLLHYVRFYTVCSCDDVSKHGTETQIEKAKIRNTRAFTTITTLQGSRLFPEAVN